MTGNSTVKLLTILDTLDSYFFDRMDVNNSLDTLYAKIFPPLPEPPKDGNLDGKDSKLDYVSVSVCFKKEFYPRCNNFRTLIPTKTR